MSATASKMRDNVERWLIHGGLLFENVKNPENTFQVLIKHADQSGISAEIFEPKSQQGVLVIGSKVTMKNKQIARYLGFNDKEKQQFEKKMADYAHSIQAINRNVTEDGKRKIGVYVVLDKEEDVNQQGVLDAINRVSEMHEKTARFLRKTF